MRVCSLLPVVPQKRAAPAGHFLCASSQGGPGSSWSLRRRFYSHSLVPTARAVRRTASPSRDTAWAMSEENVETIRAVFEAINQGDLDAAIAYLPSDFVADWSASLAPESGLYRGRDEVRRAFAWTTESWSEVEYFEDEIIDAGDQVVRVGGVRARGKGSGADVTAKG